MKANVSQPESWKRVIDIEVPEPEVQSAFNDKLQKYQREIKLPGFRQGKVPASIIKQRYGNSIRAEIIDDLVQKSYREACKDNAIDPVSGATVQDIKAPEGEDLSIRIETEVDPPIEITGYENLKIKSEPKKITDKDVDDAVNNLRERMAEFKDIERPAQKGDFIKVEYLRVVIDGEEKPDITSPTQPVELGGENGLKDFEKGISGHSTGETLTVNVTFPKDYPDEQIAGKQGEFEMKINSVQEKVLPGINEAFLRNFGDFADENTFREHVRNQLQSEAAEQAKNEAYNKAIDTLIKNNPFDVPPSRIEHFIDYMFEEAQRYQRQGQPVPDRKEIAERYNETAIRSIKRHRIIDYIASKEKIKATQEEVDQEIQRLASMYNQEFDTLKQVLRKNGTTDRIRTDIREQKTLDFLIGESPSPSE